METKKILSTVERKKKRIELKKTKISREKEISKAKKILKGSSLLEKNQDIQKSIRMKKDVAGQLKVVSALLDITQGELIDKLLTNYMDTDDIYKNELKPLLKKIKKKEVKLINF